MRHTENPVTYPFARPAVKQLIYALHKEGLVPYNHARKAVGAKKAEFKRMTERLARQNVILLRSAEGAGFEDGRIQVAVELSDYGHKVAEALIDLDEVLREHKHELGPETTDQLLEA